QLDTIDFRNRVYYIVLGRPAQEDPSGFAGGATDFYQWEGNRPTNAIDPMGLETPSAGGYGSTIAADKRRVAEERAAAAAVVAAAGKNVIVIYDPYDEGAARWS